MAKASYFIEAAVFLCSTILLLSALPYRGQGHPHPHTSPSSTYKSYIVLIIPPPQADTMDDEACRSQSWYQSFLPSNLTDSGEPCITHSYKTVFHGFSARLTEAELDVMSKKPGFGHWFPVGKRFLQHVMMD